MSSIKAFECLTGHNVEADNPAGGVTVTIAG